MVPGGISGYSHQTRYPRVSSSASLHCIHILLFLSLPFLHHLFAFLSGPPGSLSIWGCLRSARPYLCLMVQGSSLMTRHDLASLHHCPAWRQTSLGRLRLDPCLGPMVPIWFSQTRSLPGPPQRPFLRLTPACGPGSSSFCIAPHPGRLSRPAWPQTGGHLWLPFLMEC